MSGADRFVRGMHPVVDRSQRLRHAAEPASGAVDGRVIGLDSGVAEIFSIPLLASGAPVGAPVAGEDMHVSVFECEDGALLVATEVSAGLQILQQQGALHFLGTAPLSLCALSRELCAQLTATGQGVAQPCDITSVLRAIGV